MNDSVDTSKSPAWHRRVWARVLAAVCVCILLAGGALWVWLQSAGNSHVGAITMTAEQIERNRWHRYAASVAATADTITPEVQAALDTLAPDLENARQDLKTTLAKLQLEDPHLAVTLRDPQFAPLVGSNGGRPLADSLSKRQATVSILIADFEANYKGAQADKQALVPVLQDSIYHWWVRREERPRSD
jgi:hypothetical protein